MHRSCTESYRTIGLDQRIHKLSQTDYFKCRVQGGNRFFVARLLSLVQNAAFERGGYAYCKFNAVPLVQRDPSVLDRVFVLGGDIQLIGRSYAVVVEEDPVDFVAGINGGLGESKCTQGGLRSVRRPMDADCEVHGSIFDHTATGSACDDWTRWRLIVRLAPRHVAAESTESANG